MTSLSEELNVFKEETFTTLQKVKTPTAFEIVIKRIISNLGFSHYDITCINSQMHVDVVSSNVPQSLFDTYFGEGFDKDDLSNAYVNASSDPLYYSHLHQYVSNSPVTTMEQVRRTMEVYSLMRSFGFFDAYSIPLIKTTSPEKIIFTVESEHTCPNEFAKLIISRRAKITALANISASLIAPLKLISRNSPAENTSLNEKQVAILEALGKHSMTPQQAADFVGLKESTVRTYCKLIKEKLGKQTLGGAIFEATRLGIITAD